jgi:hypothetical protein
MRKPEQTIEETCKLLVELVDNQEKQIKIGKETIALQDQLIDINDKQVALYEKMHNRLLGLSFILFVISIVELTLLLSR